MEIIGLTKEALNYLYKHSNFNKYSPDQMPIGCGYMDGTVSMNAIMYKKEKINDNTVIALFEYPLDNGTAKEVIQEIIDDKIYLCLSTKNRRKFKWDIKGER